MWHQKLLNALQQLRLLKRDAVQQADREYGPLNACACPRCRAKSAKSARLKLFKKLDFLPKGSICVRHTHPRLAWTRNPPQSNIPLPTRTSKPPAKSASGQRGTKCPVSKRTCAEKASGYSCKHMVFSIAKQRIPILKFQSGSGSPMDEPNLSLAGSTGSRLFGTS